MCPLTPRNYRFESQLAPSQQRGGEVNPKGKLHPRPDFGEKENPVCIHWEGRSRSVPCCIRSWQHLAHKTLGQERGSGGISARQGPGEASGKRQGSQIQPLNPSHEVMATTLGTKRCLLGSKGNRDA